jgi:hypothetical protein
MWLKPVARIAALAIILLLLLLSMSLFVQPLSAGGRGILCNDSTLVVWTTVEFNANTPRTAYWDIYGLGPGQCIQNVITKDVEGLWGKSCDNRGKCGYQLWKLGDGITHVSDYGTSPLPPGPELWISSMNYGGGWVSPNPSGDRASDFRHYRPPLGQIHYTLR